MRCASVEGIYKLAAPLFCDAFKYEFADFEGTAAKKERRESLIAMRWLL
ncbi:MAG: hypothetical protein IJ111_08535 [Eggerthellaceae bacterium]|nr:hypothetical protein [Eggerthellaceae bacterium]